MEASTVKRVIEAFKEIEPDLSDADAICIVVIRKDVEEDPESGGPYIQLIGDDQGILKAALACLTVSHTILCGDSEQIETSSAVPRGEA